MSDRTKILAVVFAVALIIRLITVAGVWSKLNPDADIDWYRTLGRNLAAGKGFVAGKSAEQERPLLTRTPVYPLFLAGLIKTGGDRLEWFLTVQCVLGALTCVLTALLAARWLPWRGAMAAGLLVALDPNSVMRCAHLQDEFIFTLLVAAGMCFLAWRTETAWDWLLAGLVWSLAALSRPGAVGLGVVVIVAGLVWRVRWTCLALFLAGYLPLICLWAAYNQARTGLWFVSTAVTENLLLQHAAAVEAEKTGELRPVARARLHQQFGEAEFFTDTTNLAESLRAYQHASLEIFRSAPLLTIKHLVRSWAKILFAPGKLSLGGMYHDPPPSPARWWPLLYSAALVVVWALSLIGMEKLGRSALLFGLLVPYFLVFGLGSSRFRAHITPLLAVLAVAGFMALWARLRQKPS